MLLVLGALAIAVMSLGQDRVQYFRLGVAGTLCPARGTPRDWQLSAGCALTVWSHSLRSCN